ncbi:MAG TPA: hypothetical protein VF384_01615 [Planctomycetota bacterium]
MDPVLILRGVLPPIVAAILLVSVGGSRLLALAAGLGLYFSYAWLHGWPPWPHELWVEPSGNEWLLWAILTAALVATLERAGLLRTRVALAVAVAGACASTWLVLCKAAAHWSMSLAVLHVGAASLIAVLSVFAHRVVLRAAPAGPAPAILFTVVLSVDSVVLTLGSSALLGQLCGAAAAALGAAAGTTLWRPFRLLTADGTWIGLAHALFIVAGVHLAYVGWPAAACALIAPLTLCLRTRAVSPRAWMFASSALVLGPLAGALCFAWFGSSSGY